MRLNLMGGVDISLPNISYCEDVKDVHYTPYNLVIFYVGNITEPQTVKIYTDSSTYVDVTVSEGNKWYTYVLPKDKGLCMIEGDSVKKVVVKADISFKGVSHMPDLSIIPSSTIEASFKGSNANNVTNIGSMFNSCSNLTSLDVSCFNTSNVNKMGFMFNGCRGLTSLDVSSFDTRNVTNMGYMFSDCSGLTSLYVSNFNTSNVTMMYNMFYNCSNLTSLDLSKWDISKVTDMGDMFSGCSSLKTITMVGCTTETINKIKAQLAKDNITGFTIVTE